VCNSTGFTPAVPLDGEQRVRRLNRPMLPRVAGKDYAGIPFLCQPQQFEHLPSADLPGFVHDDDRAFGEFALGQKVGDRGRRRESAFSMSTTC
jgi:hypothetical protein